MQKRIAILFQCTFGCIKQFLMVFRYSYIYCNLLFIRIIASVITPPPLCIAECRLNAKLIEIDNVALDGAFQPIVFFIRQFELPQRIVLG